MSTGDKIHQIRMNLGVSQYELADKVGVLNQSQISKIESGMRKVTDRDLVVIAEALGVNVSQLLNWGETHDSKGNS